MFKNYFSFTLQRLRGAGIIISCSWVRCWSALCGCASFDKWRNGDSMSLSISSRSDKEKLAEERLHLRLIGFNSTNLSHNDSYLIIPRQDL